MKTTSHHKLRLGIASGMLAMICFLSFSETAESRDKVELDSKGVPLRAPEVTVDQVAYSYQKKAIVKLKRLIGNPKLKPQEAELLLRLGRLQQENADIIFRIAHGQAYESRKPIQLKSYTAQMKESVETLTRLLDSHPDFNQKPFVYLMRARGYAEMALRESAIADFTTIIRNYPQFDEVNAAYLALSEYAIADGKHKEAISYLSNLLKNPQLPDYPFALFKTSWSYYHLNDLGQAFAYAKRYIDYHESAGKRTGASATHKNLRNEMLVDLPLYYARGIELHLPEYPVSNALKFFKSFSVTSQENEEVYAEMLTKFTKLLRTQSSEAALVNWKEQVVQTEATRPVALDVFLMVFEDQLNKYRFKNVVDSAKDLVDLFERSKGGYSFEKATQMLLDVATKIQKSISGGKAPQANQAMSVVLIHVYRTYLKIANPTNDPGVFRVHFNLAEAFTNIDRYDQAIAHYQWIIENGKKNRSMAERSGVNLGDAGLKAISIRYKDLKKVKLIPDNLKPKNIEEDHPGELQPKLAEWVRWIFSIDEVGVKKDHFDQSDFYFFEANRALYHHGYIVKSIKQMREFVDKSPDSKYAVPMASLVLDTLILSKSWDATNKMARDYIALTDWKDKKFKERLVSTASDSYLKILEDKFAQNDFQAVLSLGEKIDSDYKDSYRKADILNLMGRAALAKNRHEEAMILFDRLIREQPQSKYTADVMLLRAQYSESRYDFKSSVNDYMRYLKDDKKKATPQELNALREKIIVYSWLSGDRQNLKQTLSNPEICSPALKRKCDSYAWLAVLDTRKEMRGKKEIQEAYQATGQAVSSEVKAIAAAITLQHRKSFGLTEATNLIDMISLGWKRLDPFARFSLTYALTEGVPVALESARREVKRANRVRADRESIERRVAAIRKVETFVEKVGKLPWIRIQVESLNTIADLYQDLAEDIKSIPAPESLTGDDLKAYQATMIEVAQPFEKTGKAIREKTFELASRSGVEEATFQKVAQPYFASNPELRKTVLSDLDIPAGRALGVEVLEKVDSRGKWNRLNEASDEPAQRVKVLWAKAIVDQRWSEVAYYLSEIKAKGLIPPGVVVIMTSISLAAAGAKAEGLLQLEEIRKQTTMDFDEGEKEQLTMVLIQQLVPTLARMKIKELMEEFDEKQVASGASLSQQEASLLARWSDQ